MISACEASASDLTGFDLAGRELVELGVEQVAIQLALVLELGGRAGVLHAAIVQDDHVVARLDRRRADGA